MIFNKTIVLSFAAGLVAGALGYKFISENQDLIKAKMKQAGLVPEGEDNLSAEASAGESADLSVEELMAQKERLEDLIAEYQAKKGDQQ